MNNKILIFKNINNFKILTKESIIRQNNISIIIVISCYFNK